MNVDFIILIVLFNYLRKKLPTESFSQQWEQLIKGGFTASIALLVVALIFKQLQPFCLWIAHGMLIWLIYATLTRPELKSMKSWIYAVIPLAVINLLEDLTKLISASFYKEWISYFQVANIFAVVWLIAMAIVNNKQRKALEKEKLKAEEKEQEFKLSQSMKAALEVQVAERTSELVGQKERLQQIIDELKNTQTKLIQSEKMASLGELTAGIAHEIQNPLNFVNNFSEVNAELISELQEEIDKGNLAEVKALANDIFANEQKINHHGRRADAIVKGMLQHSRSSSGVKEPTAINSLADEYLRLAYHGLRAKDKTFNATLKTSFDETIGQIMVIPQDIGRVILNLITNAFYATTEKKKLIGEGYEPTVSVRTFPGKLAGKLAVCIEVKDNGNGIPSKLLDKIYQPFFTTKPTGQGTGLGLSMSYDIVSKGHGGELTVETVEGEGATFTIILPV